MDDEDEEQPMDEPSHGNANGTARSVKATPKAPPILRFTEDELIVLLIEVPSSFGKLGDLPKSKEWSSTSMSLASLASPDCFSLVKSSSSILEGLSRAGRQMG